MVTTRRYVYPLWLTVVYLSLPYLIAVGSFVGYVWGASTFLPEMSRFVGVVLSLLLSLAALYYMRFHIKELPVAVEVSDGQVSLFRFRKYCEFSIQDVRQVKKKWWEPGWVEVRFADGAKVKRFAVTTDLQGGVDELIELLRQGQDGH